MKQTVNIVEVGPRDGFQSLLELVPAEKKLEIIAGLIESGVRHIEVASFVSPKAIPQMKDAGEVADYCSEHYPELDLSALVPNLRGAQLAMEHGLRKVTYVISLSESHNMANTRRSRKESLDAMAEIQSSLSEIEIDVGLATAFGCPFEGKPVDETVMEMIESIRRIGVRSITLCDTIGVADPAQVRRIVALVQGRFPDCAFQLHIHDTRGMGLVNSLAGIEAGITSVQSTLGGLGGCPFAPGASGNTATEDLVYMLEQMGYDTGIDFDHLLYVAKRQYEDIQGNYSGHHIHIGAQGQCI